MSTSFKLALFVGVVTSLFLWWSNIDRNRPRVVFCDVGQGDAIYLRLPEGQDVLIDAGSSRKVLSCLNENLPYFDRTVDFIFISHDDKDHIGGLSYILDNFNTQMIYMSPYRKEKPTDVFSKAISMIKQKHIPLTFLEQGDLLALKLSQFYILWPQARSYNGTINEQASLVDSFTPTKEKTNNKSLVIFSVINNKSLLFLGDIDALYVERLLEQSSYNVDILKVSHHGSRYGTSEKLLDLAQPTTAVISVGKNNFYGHPAVDTIDLLKASNITIRRTDKEGNITIELN